MLLAVQSLAQFVVLDRSLDDGGNEQRESGMQQVSLLAEFRERETVPSGWQQRMR